MSDEWTDWRDHDGKGCPCLGQMVRVEFCGGRVLEAIAGSGGGKSWLWGSGYNKILRYRIRKPRALQQLIEMVEMVETLPVPVKHLEVTE
ncbi:MAG: hypothetical protein JKY94_02185 [Rhodobacteraceae bacterium]|nr:hypothetical protein [Paracoccaceae bacterium]